MVILQLYPLALVDTELCFFGAKGPRRLILAFRFAFQLHPQLMMEAIMVFSVY